MDLAVKILCFLVLVVSVSGAEPFRRYVGHQKWHHGTFEEVKGKVRAEASHLLHSQARVPFHVPLEVNVVLVGFNGDGAYRFAMDAEALVDFMKKTFPVHTPGCLETGMSLDITHDIYYTVIRVGQLDLMTLEWETRHNMVGKGVARENEWGREIPAYEVEATKLETTFNKLYNALFNYEEGSPLPDMNKPVPNVIFITNYDKVRMDPRRNTTTTLEELKTHQIEDLSKDEMTKQEGGYVYRYTYNGGAATQVWLSSGRYAVIDISAGPCVYGKIESEEGSISYRSIPRLQPLLFPRRRDAMSVKEIGDSFRGLLSALIISAIEHVISPDVRFERVDPTMRLLVPVIVFNNHYQNYPLQQGSNFSTDLQIIENEVKRLVPPGQEVVVVGGIHNLHDHEKLAIAVMKAMKSFSVHETRKDGKFHPKGKTFIDGGLLREEFLHSSDILAAGLLEAADPALTSKFYREDLSSKWSPSRFNEDLELKEDDAVIQSRSARWGAKDKEKKKRPKEEKKKKEGAQQKEKSYGTRVLPVFVFSLEGVDPELLMQGEELMSASPDAVFVLQHDNDSVPLTYVSDKRWIQADATSPLRHIIAGLASVVGGLAAPYERASHIHGRPMHNWLWASGHHPFGPFTKTNTLSQLLVDSSLRNAIYARVDTSLKRVREANVKIQTFTSQHLHTILGEKKGSAEKGKVELWLDMFYQKTTLLPQPVPQTAVDKLEKYLSGLEDQLVNLASYLYDHRLQDAFKNSTVILRSSSVTQDYVDHILWKEKENMRCCRVEYAAPVSRSSHALLYGGILVAGFLVYFLVIFFSSPQRDHLVR